MLNVIKRSVGRSQLALVGTLLLLGATGCESLRELSWKQGEGENLHELSAFKGSTFKATTGAKRFKGQTSRADQLVVLPGFDKLNNLDAVELQFTEGLFKDVNLSDFIFYGRENHEYTFRYDFTDDFVILSKIAPVQDIPSQELTYAESVGEGLYRVPMMGLPISLFTVEIVRDPRGKDTRKQGEYKKDYLHEATHFRISLEGIKYFETTGKQDLLPVTFFNPEDEWFFTKTLVGRPINSLSILGSQVQALKIKFARTNNSVIGVDLNIAPEQVVLDPTKTITALEFPVEWVDYRLEKSGKDAWLKETKLGDKEPTSKYWMERQYALMDFNNADRLDRAFTLDNKLEKLEIGNDYLSFNIYESTTGNTYKYSLAKVNRQVPGQVLHADDATLFHVFSQRKKVIDGNLFTQSPDIDNIMFGTRFYPDASKPEIVYHLSDNSPDVPEFEEAVRTAIASWDEAFQAAGTDIRVRFDDQRVELGDVRYNQIVLYGYEIDSSMEGGGMLLGFGPSLQDTRSGLTYSAATHIYLRAYREGLISSIRSFVRAELGLYEDKRLTSVPSFAAADALESLTPPVVGNSNSAGLFQLMNYLSDTRVFPNQSFSRNYAEKLMPSEMAKRSLETFQWTPGPKVAKLDGECEHGAVAARSTSWKKIRETCLVSGNQFNDYLETLKVVHQGNPAIVNLANEEEAVLACAQPLMKDLLISTLIHEVGHNLGLGHNFAASSDFANFAKTAEGQDRLPVVVGDGLPGPRLRRVLEGGSLRRGHHPLPLWPQGGAPERRADGHPGGEERPQHGQESERQAQAVPDVHGLRGDEQQHPGFRSPVLALGRRHQPAGVRALGHAEDPPGHHREWVPLQRCVVQRRERRPELLRQLQADPRLLPLPGVQAGRCALREVAAEDRGGAARRYQQDLQPTADAELLRRRAGDLQVHP